MRFFFFLWPSCVVSGLLYVVPNVSDKKKEWRPFLLKFSIPDIGNLFFCPSSISLSRGINQSPHVSYIQNGIITQLFLLPPLSCFSGFSLLLCLSREIIIATVSPMTHIPRIPSPCYIGDQKKQSKNNIVLSEIVSFLYCAQKCVCLFADLRCVVIIVLFFLFTMTRSLISRIMLIRVNE